MEGLLNTNYLAPLPEFLIQEVRGWNLRISISSEYPDAAGPEAILWEPLFYEFGINRNLLGC